MKRTRRIVTWALLVLALFGLAVLAEGYVAGLGFVVFILLPFVALLVHEFNADAKRKRDYVQIWPTGPSDDCGVPWGDGGTGFWAKRCAAPGCDNPVVEDKVDLCSDHRPREPEPVPQTGRWEAP